MTLFRILITNVGGKTDYPKKNLRSTGEMNCWKSLTLKHNPRFGLGLGANSLHNTSFPTTQFHFLNVCISCDYSACSLLTIP